MDFGRRNTKKYTFRTPALQKLRRLGSQVLDPESFRERYENLLTILNTSVEKGILETLFSFMICCIIASLFRIISFYLLWKNILI